ncbi:hypothetical protein [Phocoenobacter skyensis]|uniref:hypothetical protein n=1 Tax=Phocoenobacter skyensis TaxID=97481 RepID=UPI00274EB0CB|nr:hypothetical protein [Pasteurella skyensis]MDP8185305.1 hypothetical protein [Pasteurella skyensis]
MKHFTKSRFINYFDFQSTREYDEFDVLCEIYEFLSKERIETLDDVIWNDMKKCHQLPEDIAHFYLGSFLKHLANLIEKKYAGFSVITRPFNEDDCEESFYYPHLLLLIDCRIGKKDAEYADFSSLEEFMQIVETKVSLSEKINHYLREKIQGNTHLFPLFS